MKAPREQPGSDSVSGWSDVFYLVWGFAAGIGSLAIAGWLFWKTVMGR